MVNKYMKARKLAKLLQLLREFNLDPRELKKQVDKLENQLKETQSNLNSLCKKLDFIEQKASTVQESKEEGLSFYEMYQEMMTGVPTKVSV